VRSACRFAEAGLMIVLGIRAMPMVRCMVSRMIVRCSDAGVMVAHRHAQPRRRGRHSLDRDGKCQH
jgi:hypothetical protein